MNHTKLKWIALAVTLAAMLALGACKKKVAPTPPPPPPSPAAPTASLTVTPNTIERGQTVTLAWQTSNATSISIDNMAVQPSGSLNQTPAQATSYRLVAKGPGGTQEAFASVTVTEPPAPEPPRAIGPTDEELFARNVKDVFFSFDKFDVRMDQQQTMQVNAEFLTQHPGIHFTIEGHCDDRGSVEYNLALGDSRANSAKQALVSAGVSPDRIQTLSIGKERPFCMEHTQECWPQNRRAHLLYQK